MGPGRGLESNLALFVAFRVLFQARFYYPVLGVFFGDLGLSPAQYAVLNAVWAATILLLEIPSGALADTLGRKKMMVAAAVLMVAEMALLVFAAPGAWLFPMLLLNRILSGMAEACASGADEALAYASLPADSRSARWPDVLACLLRWQSAAFVVVMLLGALLYDRNALAGLAGGFGWDFPFENTARWPVAATLLAALACLAVAAAMREPRESIEAHRPARRALGNVLAGARAVFGSRRLLWVLAAAVVGDSAARVFITFASNYQRLIGLPEAVYGLTGAALGLLGFSAAPLGHRMLQAGGIGRNFAVVFGLLLAGFAMAGCAVRIWGVVALVPVALGMQLTGFFTSHYLNLWAREEVRATILSFRGIALNAGYGLAGLGMGGLLALHSGGPDPALAAAFRWMTGAIAAGAVALWIWPRGEAGPCHKHLAKGTGPDNLA